MNQSPFASPAAPAVQVTAALETVRNLLLSHWALTAADDLAVEPWIRQAAAQLSPEQRQFNRLLFAAFGAALIPEDAPADFPSYLTQLAEQSTTAWHGRLDQAVQTSAEPELHVWVEAQLHDPAALQGKIVEHFRTLWEGLFAAEWKRHTAHLSGMTRTSNELILSQPRWQKANALEALRFLLQSEPNDQQMLQLAGVQRLILVWSPHLHAHCTRLGSADSLWVVRKFDPQLMRRDPINRAEALGPLTTLSDETRLHILELLVENGELRAQELIAQLGSSQGNVSRHLKQLAGGGFISERRAEGANKFYAVNHAGVQRLIFLLRQLLSSDNAQSVGQLRQAELQLQQVRAAAPPALHDFLDEQGRITRWSSKLRDQQAMMAYLAEKFEAERSYNEREVNETLRQWYLDADYVLIRRSMIDAGLLLRTTDGARYWRGG
jgi:DNA-binding transcriptional ArsR family regulator